jgi:yeast amino acid transporter
MYCSGFAVGWEYAIGWLTILPFEISAFALTIEFWRDDINIGVWVMMFTVLIIMIQVFGVRGFGEGSDYPFFPLVDVVMLIVCS